MSNFDSYANYQTFVDEVYSQALSLGLTIASNVQARVHLPDFFGTGDNSLPPLDITVSRGSLPTAGLYAGQLLLDMNPGHSFYRTFHVGSGSVGGWTPLSSIAELVHPGLRTQAASQVSSEPNSSTGSIKRIAKLTQVQYDALPEKDPDTLYVIVAG